MNYGVWLKKMNERMLNIKVIPTKVEIYNFIGAKSVKNMELIIKSFGNAKVPGTVFRLQSRQLNAIPM